MSVTGGRRCRCWIGSVGVKGRAADGGTRRGEGRCSGARSGEAASETTDSQRARRKLKWGSRGGRAGEVAGDCG